MDKELEGYFSGLHLGAPQNHKNFSIIPVMLDSNGGPLYRTMKEALENDTLIVSELTAGGSVPELKVTNKGDIPVLLLDGEELSGAKQNRVLNTTILIDSNVEIVIPVSCTEQGRWSYTSHHFIDSGLIMASKARRAKVRSVHENLKYMAAYRSDQGEVWNNIREMAVDAQVSSRTDAMKDVYKAKEDKLAEYILAMECQPGQKGMIAFINGVIAGFDCLSLTPAYAALHSKLVKSYAMEALLEKERGVPEVTVGAARAFLEAAAQCAGQTYKSVGLGWDHRFEAETMVGSMLECDGHVIHAAFFPINQGEKVGYMSGYRKRRAYRT